MSRRTERVGSLIRSLVARAIQTELQDPRIPPITSITHVDVAADFSVAKIYVSVFAETEAKRNLALRALQSSSGHLRYLLGQDLELRKLPALVFKLDETIRKSLETIEIIDRLNVAPSAASDDDPLVGDDDPEDHDSTTSEPETHRREA